MLTDKVDKDIQRFQQLLLRAILCMGAAFNGMFVLAELTGINSIGSPQLEITIACIIGSVGLLLSLIRNPNHFRLISTLLVGQCFVQFTSAFIFVPQDELRIVWFFLLIGGGYILLGSRAGVACTVLSIALLLAANTLTRAPYSHNAIVTCSLALTLNGVLFHMFSRFSNRLNDRLLTLARNDPLTGLFNSRAYYELCENQIRTLKRSSESFAILFIDLDYFKRINDEYGHAAGDKVLRVVAECLTKMKRESDLLARVGGEEFSMFLPKTDLVGAIQMAERTLAAIRKIRLKLDSHDQLTLTASIGVANQHDDQWTMAAIEREADQAMYEAKAAGRNQVVAFKAA